MSTNAIWYFEKKDLFDILKSNEWHELLPTVKVIKYNKGDFVYLPLDNADKVFIVKTGKIKIGTIQDENREIILALLEKNELFGEYSMFGNEVRNEFAQAVSKSEVYVIPLQTIVSLANKDAKLNLKIMGILGQKLQELEARLESLVFKDSKTRVIEFLVKNVEKYGERVGYEWVIRNFITHQDVASLTATSRQTVTMVLNDLRNQNIIQFDRKRFLVRDLNKLKNFTY